MVISLHVASKIPLDARIDLTNRRLGNLGILVPSNRPVRPLVPLDEEVQREDEKSRDELHGALKEISCPRECVQGGFVQLDRCEPSNKVLAN